MQARACARTIAGWKPLPAKKLGPVESEKPKKPRRARADAAVIAGAAIDLVEHWFTQRRAKVTGFSVVGATFIAEGHTAEGEVLGRTITIKRSTLLVEAEPPPHMRATFRTLGFHAPPAQAPSRTSGRS